MIAGGRYAVRRGEVAGSHLVAAVQSVFPAADSVAERIVRLIRIEHDMLGGAMPPRFSVMVADRDNGQVAGTQIDDFFLALVDRRQPPVALDLLFAHEILHRWLGDGAYVIPPSSHDSLLSGTEWLNEGMTEYGARQILRSAGMMSERAYADKVNADLWELARNAYRNATRDEVRAAIRTGRYMQDHKRLSYTKGPLMALAWDRALREKRSGGTVLSVIRDYITRATANGGHAGANGFTDLLAAAGVPSAAADVQRFVVDGDSIPVRADALGPSFVLVDSTRYRFSAGLDVSKSRQALLLVAVDPGGPAGRAGLATGMPIRSITAATNVDQPMEVTLDSAGVAKTVRYLPLGEAMRVRQFRPVSPPVIPQPRTP